MVFRPVGVCRPLKKTDTAYKEVRGKLAYLDISLPQRSSKGIAENIDNYFKILTDKSLQTPTFSVTSMLPSLMNGGKDFCSWSKHDELLYKTIRKPMEAILGQRRHRFCRLRPLRKQI